MIEGIYSFAGHTVRIISHYSRVHDLCRGYVSSGEPEESFFPTLEEIRREQVITDRENRLEGNPEQQFSEAYLENLAVYRKIARWMVDRDTLLFHGSVIAVDGRAYLFAAKSGTGKSTHARLWREALGDRAVMINDDKPLLHIRKDGVTACGTPWNGKHHLGNNIMAPLDGIAILHRGDRNIIVPAEAKEAFPMLVQQSFRPEDPVGMGKTLELLDRMRALVPVWDLTCNMEPEAAEVAFRAMSHWKGMDIS